MADLELDIELSIQQLSVFNTLFTIGLILLTLVMLPPVFSRNARRSPLWFTFMGSWLLYCVSGLLLVGNQLGPDPPFALCLVQASLIHSVPTLGSIAGVCFIIDLYLTLRFSLYRSYWIPLRRTPTLLAFPAIGFFALMIAFTRDWPAGPYYCEPFAEYVLPYQYRAANPCGCNFKRLVNSDSHWGGNCRGIIVVSQPTQIAGREVDGVWSADCSQHGDPHIVILAADCARTGPQRRHAVSFR